MRAESASARDGRPGRGGGLSDSVIVVDFARAPGEWFVVSDGVMGGVSSGTIVVTADGIGVFAGRLSLENNGGFASVRTDVSGVDLRGTAGLVLRVRGDGRAYQVRLRTDERFHGIAYGTTVECSGCRSVPTSYVDNQTQLEDERPGRGRFLPVRPEDARPWSTRHTPRGGRYRTLNA